MSIDPAGPRFYTQQLSASKGGTKKVARLKKDIVADIQGVLGFNLKSLKNVTNPDLEVIYDKVNIYKR